MVEEQKKVLSEKCTHKCWVSMFSRLQSIQKRKQHHMTYSNIPNHMLTCSKIPKHTQAFPKISKHNKTTQAQHTIAYPTYHNVSLHILIYSNISHHKYAYQKIFLFTNHTHTHQFIPKHPNWIKCFTPRTKWSYSCFRFSYICSLPRIHWYL